MTENLGSGVYNIHADFSEMEEEVKQAHRVETRELTAMQAEATVFGRNFSRIGADMQRAFSGPLLQALADTKGSIVELGSGMQMVVKESERLRVSFVELGSTFQRTTAEITTGTALQVRAINELGESWRHAAESAALYNSVTREGLLQLSMGAGARIPAFPGAPVGRGELGRFISPVGTGFTSRPSEQPQLSAPEVRLLLESAAVTAFERLLGPAGSTGTGAPRFVFQMPPRVFYQGPAGSYASTQTFGRPYSQMFGGGAQPGEPYTYQGPRTPFRDYGGERGADPTAMRMLYANTQAEQMLTDAVNRLTLEMAAGGGGGGAGGGGPTFLSGGGGDGGGGDRGGFGLLGRLLTGGPHRRFGAGRFFPGIPGAAAGSVLALGGLDVMHAVTTLGSVAGFGAAGAAGAGLIGLGAAGQIAVGGGADVAVLKSTISDTQTLSKAMDAVTQAQAVYGAGSRQAAVATKQLDQQIKDLGGTLNKHGQVVQPGIAAELRLAKAGEQLNTMWDKQTQLARVQAVNILMQVVQLGKDYVPRVAAAARTNLAIINTSIKPLFDWLEGPKGIAIFNNLENNFKRNLPTSIHAFSQAMELFLRIVSLASNYTGGFVESIDRFFTRMNKKPDSTLNDWIHKLVGDFQQWELFFKALGKVIFDIFRNDAGTGKAIIATLTEMLDKLDGWLTSVKGRQDLHNIFEVHKQEVLALLQILPGLLTGLGRFYLVVAPTLTKAMTTIFSAIGSVLNAIAELGSKSPILENVLVLPFAGGLLATKILGVKTAFGLLKDAALALGGEQVAGSMKRFFGFADAFAGAPGLMGTKPGQQGQLFPTGVVQEGEKEAEKFGKMMKTRTIRGLGIATIGTLLAQGIGDSIHGSVGTAISNIGTDASIGAGIGAVFGPEGIIAGTFAGGLVGAMHTFLVDDADKEAKQWAQRFTGTLANQVSPQTTKTLAEAAKRAIEEAQQAAAPREQARTPGSGARGRGPKMTGPMFEQASQLLTEQYNTAYNAGFLTGKAWIEGVQKVKFPTTILFVRDMIQRLSDVPKGLTERQRKVWQEEAASEMLAYASSLEAHKKLPAGSVDNMIASLEYKFPGLQAFLESQGRQSDKSLATGLKLTQAQSNLSQALAQMRQQWDDAAIAQRITFGPKGNVEQNTAQAMDDLRLLMKSKNQKIREEATAEYHRLQGDVKAEFGRMLAHTGAQMQAMSALIVGGSSTQAAAAESNYKNFVKTIGQAMKDNVLNTNTGMGLIVDATNQILHAFGVAKVPAPLLKQMTPKDLQLLATTPQGRSAAANYGGYTYDQGGVIQVGPPGARGRDTIPMNIGGMPVMVGAGEQVVVLNHSQQRAMNSILKPVGGLQGFFDNRSWPLHHMASGGFVPEPGTNFQRGQEPELARRLGLLANAMGVTIYGLSGYRTPAHSEAVGGFADDPHTRGAAADIGVNSLARASASAISTAMLHKFGLDRPFDESNDPSNSEVNHIQLLGAIIGGAMGSAAAALAVSHLTDPKVKGTGALADMLRGALHKATGAANKFIDKQVPTGIGGAGGLPLLKPGPAAHEIYAFFKTKGLSDIAIAGILGNWQQESGLNASLTGPSGLGLAQWIGGRRAAAYALARMEHTSPATIPLQLQFAWEELTTSHASALTALRAAKTPEEAARVFEQLFEGAGTPNMPARIAYANQFFAQGLAAGGSRTGRRNVQVFGHAARASTRTPRAPHHHHPYRKKKLRPFKAPPGFKSPFLDAYNAISTDVNNLTGWQGYIEGVHGLVPVTVTMTLADGTEVINWGDQNAAPGVLTGMIDPTTGQKTKGIYDRLREIGNLVTGGVDKYGRPEIVHPDKTTELGIDQIFSQLYGSELFYAQQMQGPFTTWLAGERTDLAKHKHKLGVLKAMVERLTKQKEQLQPDRAAEMHKITDRYTAERSAVRAASRRRTFDATSIVNAQLTKIIGQETLEKAGIPRNPPDNFLGDRQAWHVQEAFELAHITNQFNAQKLALREAARRRRFEGTQTREATLTALTLAESDEKFAVGSAFDQKRIDLTDRMRADRSQEGRQNRFISTESSAISNATGSGGLADQLKSDLDPNGPLALQILSNKNIDIQGLLNERANLLGTTIQATPAGPSATDQLQAQLNQQLALTNKVLEAQYTVLSQLPLFAGTFQYGGVVPGPIGEARTVIAHAGETITPVGGGPNYEAHVHVADGMSWLKDFIGVEIHNQGRVMARGGNLALASGGGGRLWRIR